MAGNIQLTTQARVLLSTKEARQIFTGNEQWDDKKWKKALQKHFNVKKSYEGRADRIYDQVMYSCVLCGTVI